MTKHYDITGLSNEVQLGRRGGHIKYDPVSGSYVYTGADKQTLSRVKVAAGTEVDDSVNLGQLTQLETDVGDRLDTIEGNIGDFASLETDEKGSIVGAINEVKAAIGEQIGELGSISTQDADAVEITGGSISGVDLAVDTIAEHTEGAGVTVDGVLLKDGDVTAENVTIRGDLTVLGDTVSLEVSELKVTDNIIELNKDETGAGVTAGSSGIEINRGTADNVAMVWDEAEQAFVFKKSTSGDLVAIKGDFSLGEQIISRENGGLGTDISEYAGSSLIKGDGAELVKGDANQVLTSTASGIEYAYVDALRNATTGKKAVDVSGATSATGEFLEVRTEADKVFLTAKNEAGTGDVDLYIQGQGNGDVIIAANSSNEGLIIGEDGTSLTISGGAGTEGDAGNLVLKGGDGSGEHASGDVIIQAGTGGDSEGLTIVRDSAGNTVATFTGGVEDAVDYVDFVNGVGSATIKAEGASDDINMMVSGKGNGYVVAPVGYSTANAPDNAFITKGEVASATSDLARNIDPLVRRASVTTDGTATEFAIGEILPVVSGKAYFVSRVVVRVPTSFTADVDMSVVAGSQVLAAVSQLDTLAGTYIVDYAFSAQTAAGQAFKVKFASAPAASQVVEVIVEYKVDNVPA